MEILAVRMTDGLATGEFFLEKPGQMVLPLRGDTTFILCVDRELRAQPGLYSESRSPEEGSPVLSTRDPKLISTRRYT